eukprot:736917-Amphidinium_carterae.1
MLQNLSNYRNSNGNQHRDFETRADPCHCCADAAKSLREMQVGACGVQPDDLGKLERLLEVKVHTEI